MAPARKRNTGETRKTKDEAPQVKKTSPANKIPRLLLWLGVCITIIAAILGIYYTYTQQKTSTLLTQPEQTRTNNSTATKPTPPEKKKVKMKKTTKNSDITNKYDKEISKELRKVEKILEKGQFEEASAKFENLIGRYPKSPRSHFGLAQALDQLSEKRQSNQLLQKSIDAYGRVSDLPDCPVELKRRALLRMADRLSFFGRSKAASMILEKLSKILPYDTKILSDLGVQYLLSGRNNEAKAVFRKILNFEPSNGFAKSHLGFILKTTDLKNEEAIPLLYDGVRSGDKDSDHGRFYFHLGDALTRVGRQQEAYQVYGEAAKKGIFLSAWQRSLYNADTPLKAQPWWTAEESGYTEAIRKLEANWRDIRDEGMAVMDHKTGGFLPEEENLRQSGDWKQFTLYSQGRKAASACRKMPRTCALMDTIPDAARCKRGQVKYSIMFPGTHVWPHTGPTNCRLRAHLGLVIPEKVAIRVGNDTRTWKEGKVVIIDDSFDHEVWHNGSSFRMIFIVDFWHPDLTPEQRRNLTPI